eukprot:SAG31_NODE_589_length_13808_cov_3.896710_5_plen_93_part_00
MNWRFDRAEVEVEAEAETGCRCHTVSRSSRCRKCSAGCNDHTDQNSCVEHELVRTNLMPMRREAGILCFKIERAGHGPSMATARIHRGRAPA